MNKVILGLIITVCVLGMGLIMLNEKLVQSPKPETPLAPQTLTPDTQVADANKPLFVPELPKLDNLPNKTKANLPEQGTPENKANGEARLDATKAEDLPSTDMSTQVASGSIQNQVQNQANPKKNPSAWDEADVPFLEPPKKTMPAQTNSNQTNVRKDTPVVQVTKKEQPVQVEPKQTKQELAKQNTREQQKPEVKKEPVQTAQAPVKQAQVEIEKKPEPKIEKPAETKVALNKETNKATNTNSAVKSSKVTVLARDAGATIRITGSASLNGYKLARLEGPARVVVDLPGTWELKAPGVPKNKIVKNVRIGKYADKTRIVVDLSTSPSGVRPTMSQGYDMLDVRIDN